MPPCHKHTGRIAGYLLYARGGHGGADAPEETFGARGDASTPEADQPRQAPGERGGHARSRRTVDGASSSGGRIVGQGKIAWAAARNAGGGEGLARNGGHPHHVRFSA